MADDDGWRFSVEEVGPDDPDEEGTTTATGPAEEAGASVDGEAAADADPVTMVGEDDDAPTVGIATADGESGEGSVAGELVPDAPVEPGTPALENVVFTTLGAILTALVFAGFLGQLDAVTAGAITATIVGGAALLYVFFTRVGGS